MQRSREIRCVWRREKAWAGVQASQGRWEKRASSRHVTQSMKCVAAKEAMEVTACWARKARIHCQRVRIPAGEWKTKRREETEPLVQLGVRRRSGGDVRKGERRREMWYGERERGGSGGCAKE